LASQSTTSTIQKKQKQEKNEEKIEVGFKPDRPFRAAVCPQ